jgi:hypothetical protein
LLGEPVAVIATDEGLLLSLDSVLDYLDAPALRALCRVVREDLGLRPLGEFDLCRDPKPYRVNVLTRFD